MHSLGGQVSDARFGSGSPAGERLLPIAKPKQSSHPHYFAYSRERSIDRSRGVVYVVEEDGYALPGGALIVLRAA